MPRAHYKHFLTIATRWMDNDIYGHVNNVVYYSWFDTVINEYLIRVGGLDIRCGFGLYLQEKLLLPGACERGLMCHQTR